MLVGIHMGDAVPPSSGATTTEMIDNHTAADILAAASSHAPAPSKAPLEVGGVVLATAGFVGLLGLLAYFSPPRALRATL